MIEEEKREVLKYLEDYNKIKDIVNESALSFYILGNFTIEPLKPFIEVEMHKVGITTRVTIGNYDQAFQEVMDENSNLYKTNPKVIVIAQDFLKFVPECENDFYNLNLETKQGIIEERAEMLFSIIKNLRKKTDALILLNNFYLRKNLPSGILDTKDQLGVKELLSKLNNRIYDIIKDKPNVFVIDVETVLAKIGWASSFSRKMEYMADLLLTNEAFLAFAKEYGRYIKAMKGWTKKCIVLDLDNTLWGGIIGEDGLDGIKLGNTYPGNAYLDFQKQLLNLYNKGFLLTVNSKNNFEDALEVFRKHPESILKENHFAIMKINWKDKATNIKEIAAELNIGVDSLVFFDDNPTERALIKQEVPEILVVDMPEDVSLYRDTLDNLFAFDLLNLTEEDKKRNKMYVEQRQRKELETSAQSMDEFLKKLELKVSIFECDNFSIPRAAQMTNKTNQFNLTTKRYDESQIRFFYNSTDYKIYLIKVADKFGNHGITGMAIINKGSKKWQIDTFLLSCRVIGKTVEKTLIQRIIDDARSEGIQVLEGKFIPTQKNKPASTLYEDNGFVCMDENEDYSIWNLDLTKEINLWPEWIKEANL